MDGSNIEKAQAAPGRRISVAINTLNEEASLPYTLRSVRSWTDEIVVVDMHSEDLTVEVARRFGARVYLHERTGFVEPARGFALAQCTCDWVLILDADELVPYPLSRRLLEIAETGAADVVRLYWKNYLLGAPVAHTGWGLHQDSHLRFFRRGFLQPAANIHGAPAPVPGARILEVPGDPGYAVVHHAALDVADFVEKLNRYTSIEAGQNLTRSASPARALLESARTFLGRYIKQGGFRDGWRGFYLSTLVACYRMATFAKMAELQHQCSREIVEETYHRDAEQIVSEYEAESHAAIPNRSRA